MIPTARTQRGLMKTGGGFILLHLPYNEAAVAEIRRIPKAKWLKEAKCWSIPRNRSACQIVTKYYPNIDGDRDFWNLHGEPTLALDTTQSPDMPRIQERLHIHGYPNTADQAEPLP